MLPNIKKIRNIGISAHIDSGKTTITERILFYTNKIHKIHDVKSKDDVGATMDYMELEKERGITIVSAATFCEWKGHEINIIDTPGHVDFTIEVERSLRVLDGAILVLCAVGGVQSQSITVDNQMKRYEIPRIAFINKCDRNGSDPFRVIKHMREKLGHNPVALQIPIGLEKKHEGVVDLISMKAIYFHGSNGEKIIYSDIPIHLKNLAIEKREELINIASIFSDDLINMVLEDKEITNDILISAIRTGTIERKITPVLLGSAYKNKGIQPLLDSINNYLPSPSDIVNTATDLDRNNETIKLISDQSLPIIALAFKLEDGQYGQITYIRVYQGVLSKGTIVVNIRTGKKVKIGRVVRMHSNQMEDINEISAGYIGALFGIDCISGDTFAAVGSNITMTSMFVPNPVISLAIKSKNNDAKINMFKAINRFTKEDPTFKSHVDQETGDTIISGMGELHLEVYIERMRREYNSEVEVGTPKVAYKETIRKRANFDYTHKKQTGGAGQYGRIMGYIEPITEEKFIFENSVKGGAIPIQYISACKKGFEECLNSGGRFKFPLTGIKVHLDDGVTHNVDSSETAFKAAAKGAFFQAYLKAFPVIQEPIMRVIVESPIEFQGQIMGSLNQRRGIIVGANDEVRFCVIESVVPLSEMFGYSTVLRSITQGKAQFTMEFSNYKNVNESLDKKIRS